MSEDKTVHEAHILSKELEELRPHVARNAELVDATIAGAHAGLLRRLFPGEAEHAVRAHELAQLKTGFEYRHRALQMAMETKLQAVEEMCNHVLVTGKSEIRRQRQEFFAEQTLKLQAAMDECAGQFSQQLEKRFQNLTRYQNDYLRQKEEERLLRSVDQFYGMLDELSKEFMDIIHEGVSR